jgi:SSS family transporter
MALLTESQGIYFLCGYGVLMVFVTWLTQRKEKVTTELYLVANRNISLIYNAFAIAASWIWAPALLVSSEMAYTKGISGAFWFCVPNIVAVAIFAFGATRLRNLLPQGYTFPEFIKIRFDKRTHLIYLIFFLVLQIFTAAVQILGGMSVVRLLTGLPSLPVALLLVIFPLAYTFRTGLKASIITDVFQMTMILVGLFIVPWAVKVSGGWHIIKESLGGVSGKYTNIFNHEVIYTFGIITTVGLLSGLFGDQKFWQRSFSCHKKDVAKSYLLGAFIFAICPVAITFLGFIAAHPAFHGWIIPKTQLAGVVAIQQLLPQWASLVFLTLLVSCLMSSYDSAICAASSLVSIDIYRQYIDPKATGQRVLFISRLTLFVVSIIAVLIALIPGLQVLHLFLFYGTLRVATFIPSLLALFWKKTNKTGVFWGILVALVLGMPIFAYGSIKNNADIKIIAFSIVLLSSISFSILASIFRPERFDFGQVPSKSKAIVN